MLKINVLMTTRDWQLKKNGGQWLLGKAMEAFAPIGPAIVSRDEVGDPNNLQLSCKVSRPMGARPLVT